MNLTPEIKKQLEEQKKQCVFCKLISGEMPNAKNVFEDDKTVALLDIYPAVKGHVVFMTKEHYPMPAYIPGEEFKHMFSLIPGLSKSLKSAVVRTGINVFIAVGGAAGQQAPHFMAHLLPREDDDGFFNFLFNKKSEKLNDDEQKILQQNLPIMMGNHFKRHPAGWHSGNGEVPKYLDEVYNHSKVLYEDEKVLCTLPDKSLTKGQIVIYSKTEEKEIEKLSQDDSAHMFFTASLASTAVFEGLQAHGTNIILKSGRCDDNKEGKLEVHILPRWQGDKLQDLMWQPKPAKSSLDGIAKSIKDKTWNVKYKKEEEKKEFVSVEQKEIKNEVIDEKTEGKEIKNQTLNSSHEEIMKAIESLRD